MRRPSQAPCVASDLVDDPDVRRTDRRSRGYEREAPAVATPGRTADPLRGDRYSRSHPGRNVDHLEVAPPGDVPDQRGAVAIVRVHDLLQLRVVPLREDLATAGPV